MPRTLKGVTLSEAEKAQAGYRNQPHGSAIEAHMCRVLLPNGSSCQVSYRRYGARSHAFTFQEPLCQQLYHYAPLQGGVAAIEAKAQELLEAAYRKAQEAERKQMCQKPLPKSTAAKRKDNGPYMSASNAEQMAGKFAACLKNTRGRLIRVGSVYDKPEQVTEEIASGRFRSLRLVNGQELVIGICNRQAQAWQEPQFLISAKHVSENEQSQDEELENQLPDDDDLE